MDVRAARPTESPIPITCLTCGAPMTFHGERREPDEQGRPDHIRVYFCYKHGFFRLSDRKQLSPGM